VPHFSRLLREVGVLFFCRIPPAPPTIQPRRKDPRIVEYHQIVRPQQFGKLTELPIAQGGTRLHMQQSRSRPIRQRLLCNQFFRKFVVKIGD